MAIEHTQACVVAQANYEIWSADHPKHCQKCHGHGSNGAPSDPSVGMYGAEPCEECLGKGICPVCGTQHDEDWDSNNCTGCGWSWEGESESPWQDCCCHEQYEVFSADEWNLEGEAGYDAQFYDYALSDYLYDADRERRLFGR